MSSFTIGDPYKGWSEDRLKAHCRNLVRDSMNKDILICALVDSGSVEAMPVFFGDQVRRIISAYSDEPEATDGQLARE